MDRTDYQILNILQADSRCTLRHIGDQVGLTPPAVSERIRRMEECGVIRSYRIDIDRTRLDCNITGFISVSLEPEKYAAFCVFCEQSPAVISHHHVIGVFNALLQFAVRDTKELDALLAEIKTYATPARRWSSRRSLTSRRSRCRKKREQKRPADGQHC